MLLHSVQIQASLFSYVLTTLYLINIILCCSTLIVVENILFVDRIILQISE